MAKSALSNAVVNATGLNVFGGPEVLHPISVPKPVLGAGEVTVRIRAATVNPTDMLFRSGQQAARLEGIERPYIPGLEFSGEIETLGEGAAASASSELRVGMPVMGLVEPRRAGGGAYTECVRVSAASVVPIPESLSFVEAATIPMNGLTAKLGLDALDLPTGAPLLVTGGAGALGGYLIQLAKHAGLRVIADAKESDAQLISTLGADHVVPRGARMAAAVRELVPAGVLGAADAARLGSALEELIAPGGRIVGFRPGEGEDSSVERHVVSVLTHAEDAAGLAFVRDRAADGTLTPRIADTYPLSRAEDAHRRYEAGGVRGRLVLVSG